MQNYSYIIPQPDTMDYQNRLGCHKHMHLELQSGNMDNYKAAAYNVRRAVKEAKRDYGKKVELQFQEGNPRSIWQGVITMTDYKPPPPCQVLMRL